MQLSSYPFPEQPTPWVLGFAVLPEPQFDIPMMFIYGEYDPWSATGVTWLNDKKHIRVFVEPGGSHKARIGTMPEATQKKIMKVLRRWTK